MIEIDIQKTLSSAFGEMLLEVNTTVPSGELLTLYGKSGAGKTTLLRILAGLTDVDNGRIIVNGTTWLDHNAKINLPPQLRKTGFVFQDYALFPNMTVNENLQFALTKGQHSKIISELIELMELGDLQNKRPTTLSGGQQQRVALARALVQQPKLLLLDEPLSALDTEMRNKLQTYLLQVQKTYQLSTILVSHDEAEIRKMSKTVMVLENGKLVNQGAVETLFPDSKVKLKGKITAITKEEDRCKLIVEIGDNLVSVFVRAEQGDLYQVGEILVLGGDMSVC